jgi:2,4-dihydroxyhept-2-ene-1,7-dioic acid aldolase
MVAYAGFDFVIIDNEHGTSSFETTEQLLRAARASGIPAMVRCLEHDIARTLDAGAGGVLVPMVNSAAQALELVRRVRYPYPDGQGGTTPGRRGSAFSTRASGYGAFGGPEHTRRSNNGVALVLQVETPQAIHDIEAIAAVPGVDAIFIGSNDLAHFMGFENRSDAPPVQEAVRHALTVLAKAGVCSGIPAFSPADEDRYAALGARLFAGGTTGLITAAFRQAAREGR